LRDSLYLMTKESMTRIAVIGNAGGGKSILSRRLSTALDIPLFPIDCIQWKPGWTPATYDDIKHQHDQILARQRWIIDGWGLWDLIEARFAAADTIIFVDHPLVVHYWWAVKRQIACILAPRPDGPEDCPMLPMTWPLLKMIWNIHYHARPRLIKLINHHRADKLVIHIPSPKELNLFFSEYMPPE
jgi:adenylate kinase family enzyme